MKDSVAKPEAHRLAAVCLMVAAVTVSCGANAGTDQASESSRSSPATTVEDAVSAPTVEGTFDVGGHQLFMRCTGSGSPTIVYMHGYIFDPSGGGSQNAGEVPALLEDRFRVCVYDRANVGLSDSVEGPLTGRSSIRDLEALLEAAETEAPYVLVGGSFGGLLAYMYAVIHPKDVVGMVLLDPSLPGYHEESFDWQGATEQLDQTAASREAAKLEGQEPNIPVTLVGLERPDVGFVSSPEEYEEITTQVLKAQRRFLGLFPRGRLVLVDAPHYMEPVIPDRIAQEIAMVAETT